MTLIFFEVSKPADPTAPSFLDLPAELRNRVYQLYFKSTSTLRLASAQNGQVKMIHGLASHRFPQTNCYSTTSQDLNLKLLDPVGPFELQLLRVCRQLHQETASMLYSNQFCIEKKLGAHLTTHDATGHYVNHISTEWLRQIGQHRVFISKLVIDLESVCPGRCDTKQSLLQTFQPEDGYIQFGKLLQAIWANDLKIVISFVYQCRYSEPVLGRLPWTEAHTEYQGPISAENITVLFQALARDDLGMKKFRNAIGDVGIEKHGEFGIIVFWTPEWRHGESHGHIISHDGYNSLFVHSRRFSLSEDGRVTVDKLTVPKLLGLPQAIITKIVAHTLDSSTPQELDLDSFTDLRDLYGILYTTKDLHDRYLTYYLRKHTFKLSLMTSNARASFEFSKLDRLLRTELLHRVGSLTRGPRFGDGAKFSIDLHVHFGTSDLVSSMMNIRINIMPLVASTFAANRHQSWCIFLHNGTSILQGRVSTIRKLRYEVIAILSKFVKKDHVDDPQVRCPEVWIDGHGKVVDIVPTGSVEGESLQNPAKLNSVLWSAEKTGSFVGAKTPAVPRVGGLARDMYLYLKWIDR
ncbi:hypothetical protein HBH56_131710 [Parastagonospora nodorum]|uniref:DUF7730 domain-containing protein n=1 Tax=Phaeosphaeria nodorum (strain SN15 / ATCC MYA-4574 / FGSC 10173) TaxID=321614 RepID=A0A7U2I7G2_PHANO|nr:hypothetical protein HBH56_131710 [Parastagonospora nodorum]QRD02872.1 hypothetical protein JI435_115980 [Parastagonospora nodorum SN15]KAH3938104.1 hypothetical protein HBH54_006980 [Parastagonospora nodorum]KAH3949229.1 hypothetical protein HBH53_086660 [Parastagonospora nodorum]KAH3974884.1 hypothetical protein HBH52_134910 [Parastagonospora nodorum]